MALEPRPDGFHYILVQTVRGAAAGDKDGNIVPGLPTLGIRLAMSLGVPDNCVERTLTLIDES